MHREEVEDDLYLLLYDLAGKHFYSSFYSSRCPQQFSG